MPSDPPHDRPLGASLGWRQRARRYLYRSPWYDVQQDDLTLPDGSEATFTYVEHPGFVSIVPLLEDGRVLLIRSYRYPVDQWVLEVPAGGLGRPGGAPRDPREVAASELGEETGHVAGRLSHIADYWSAIGNSRSRASVFLATGVRPHGAQRLESTEHIELRPTPAEVALAMASDGRIADGHSALAWLMCENAIRAKLRGGLGTGGGTEKRDGASRGEGGSAPRMDVSGATDDRAAQRPDKAGPP